MAIHGMLAYRFPMVLEEKELQRIIKSLIPEHCDDLTYFGTIADGTDVSFPSVDKLFAYENSESTCLVSLTIRGFRNRKTTLSITFDGMHGIGSAIKYRKVCICEYEVPSEDAAERLKASIGQFTNKSRAKYWKQGKYGQIFLQTVFVLCFSLCRPLPFQYFERMGPTGILLLLALLYVIACLFLRFVQWMVGKMFPPVVFLWNGGKERYVQRKSNIVSIGISLASSFACPWVVKILGCLLGELIG